MVAYPGVLGKKFKKITSVQKPVLMKTPFEKHERDRMIYDPVNYKWGIIYFNPRDSRAIVPKRKKHWAWTLNFANPYSWIIVLAVIMFVYLWNIFK